MDAIKMQGIVKCFGPVRANDGIDFTVEQQEIHCLLGENGTGKSTLMNILFGLYHPDEGEIFIHGKKAAIANPNDAYALGIGMVYQHFMLVNQLTVLENIIIGKEQGGLFLDPKKCEEKVSELINRFGFQIDLHEKVVNLSVGMRQRVEILKTVYRGADIIILDEPTAVLTPQEVEELFKILRQLKKDGKTIIFITHKLNETMSLSDRITVIRKGNVFRGSGFGDCRSADRMGVCAVLFKMEGAPVRSRRGRESFCQRDYRGFIKGNLAYGRHVRPGKGGGKHNGSGDRGYPHCRRIL